MAGHDGCGLVALQSDLRVRREMTITLGKRQRPEPDVLIVRGPSASDLERTSYLPEDLVLVVEVVSPDSEVLDRERKPQLYAAAGSTSC
jgi:Uma2 family endonuclease